MLPFLLVTLQLPKSPPPPDALEDESSLDPQAAMDSASVRVAASANVCFRCMRSPSLNAASRLRTTSAVVAGLPPRPTESRTSASRSENATRLRLRRVLAQHARYTGKSREGDVATRCGLFGHATLSRRSSVRRPRWL